MRASIRGSMRSVIVTDSALSVGPATAVSINRKSGLFSAQKPASASSLSKIGTSSHLAIARMFSLNVSLCQRLFHLALVEEPFFGLELAGENHANLPAIRAIDGE